MVQYAEADGPEESPHDNALENAAAMREADTDIFDFISERDPLHRPSTSRPPWLALARRRSQRNMGEAGFTPRRRVRALTTGVGSTQRPS